MITEEQKQLLKKLCDEKKNLKYGTGLLILELCLEAPRISNKKLSRELGLHEVTISRYSQIINQCVDKMKKIKFDSIESKESVQELVYDKNKPNLKEEKNGL